MSEQAPKDTFGPGKTGVRAGTVASYDSDTGLGVVEDDDANRWMFHCTAIAGSLREIDQGIRVAFEVRGGGPGRFEAFDVLPVGTD